MKIKLIYKIWSSFLYNFLKLTGCNPLFPIEIVCNQLILKHNVEDEVNYMKARYMLR